MVLYYMKGGYVMPEVGTKQYHFYLNPDKISDAYLRILFSKHLNTSPAAYLKSLRFDRAKRLLSTGYYSVKTVSFMCGYENEKNFSIAFKNATGKSPSEYKKI